MFDPATAPGPLDPAKGLGPKAFLLFGIFSLGLAIAGMLSGEALQRGPIIYRSKEPKKFWEAIVTCFLVGVVLVGAYVFNIPGQGVVVILLMVAIVSLLYQLISWAIHRII